MNQDIPGYAMISGGPDNGKYRGKDGRLYRRSGNSMYEVDTGQAAPSNEASADYQGQVIGHDGEDHSHPGDDGIANRTRYSGDGVDEVLRSSLEEQETEQADPQLVQSTEQADTEQAGDTPWQEPVADDVVPASIAGLHAPSTIPSHEMRGKAPPLTVAALLDSYSPTELLSMTQSLVKSLNESKTEHDIKPRKGTADSSIRYNAEALAKYADA